MSGVLGGGGRVLIGRGLERGVLRFFRLVGKFVFGLADIRFLHDARFEVLAAQLVLDLGVDVLNSAMLMP